MFEGKPSWLGVLAVREVRRICSFVQLFQSTTTFYVRFTTHTRENPCYFQPSLFGFFQVFRTHLLLA